MRRKRSSPDLRQVDSGVNLMAAISGATMRQWAKVLAGCLALMIGASAPSLLLEVIHPHRPTASTPLPRSGQENQAQIQNQAPARANETTMDATAIATFLVAAVTALLALATYYTARDTRRTLFLAQRPRIRIRNVVVRPAGLTGYVKSAFFPQQFVGGQLYVVNVGGTRARLIEAHCEVYWTNAGVETLPMERPYEGNLPNLPDLTVRLEAGESWPLSFDSDRQLSEAESDQIKRGELLIYVMGFAAYRDDLGIARRTAFCRKYDSRRARFFAVDDPDYEHEE